MPPPAPEPPCLGFKQDHESPKCFGASNTLVQTGAEHIVMSEVFQAQDVGAHDFLVQAGRLVESTLSYV